MLLSVCLFMGTIIVNSVYIVVCLSVLDIELSVCLLPVASNSLHCCLFLDIMHIMSICLFP